MQIVLSDLIVVGAKDITGAARGLAVDDDYKELFIKDASVLKISNGLDHATIYIAKKDEFIPELRKLWKLFPPFNYEKFNSWLKRAQDRLRESEE